MKYRPSPIDTSRIQLPNDVMKLTEQLAKNTHEVWAHDRIAEGWTYGPERSDTTKRHPCLVPYEQLPESEKRYDRRTAMETLRMIMAMGYRIEKEG